MEGRIVVVDFEDDLVRVMNNEGFEVSCDINQKYLAFYAVLDTLDYEFDE